MEAVGKKPDPRRRRKKKPQRMNVEMVLRKSFCDSFKEYINHCSLFGLRQIFNPSLSWFQRIVWAMVFCTGTATIFYFLQYTWNDTLTKPLIVTLESSTYPIGSIDFPAVAICNDNRISRKALERFALEEYLELSPDRTASLEEVEQVVLNWGRLITFSYNVSESNHPMYKRMVQKYRSGTDHNIQLIMKRLAPRCEDMLLRCAWEGSIVDCSSIFSMHRISNVGHCCTFNYWVAHPDEGIKRQKESGYLYGLHVLLDPLLDDYAHPISNTLGFNIMFFDPAHLADPNAGRIIHRFSEPDTALYVELKSTKQIATNEVRKYHVDTRNCYFHDQETDSNIFTVYSYSTCLVVCRINTIISLCKCTPYYYRSEGQVCTHEHLKCLNKYREKFIYLYPFTEDIRGLEQEYQDSIYCPECKPDCELTRYSLKSYKIPLLSHFEGKDSITSFVTGVDISNKSYLNIYHPLPDADLDRLDVVYYWYEILSSIGGFTGVVIGFSFMSACEIFYFFFIRLLRHFIENLKKYYQNI